MNNSRRLVLTTVLATVMVLSTAGGITYTAVTVNQADRTAPTIVWEKPAGSGPEDDAEPHPAKGRDDTPLLKQLLPVPTGYQLGPDIEEFGNDAELSGKQAQALLEEDGGHLPGKQRKERREQVRKLKVQGLAMRSYASSDNDLVVEIQISQMKNTKAVRDLSTFQSEFAETLSVFREGPKIDDHKNAKCFLPPKDSEAELDELFCTAYQGDLLVSFTASGSKPFAEDEAAKLLKDQLDRLVSGGGKAI